MRLFLLVSLIFLSISLASKILVLHESQYPTSEFRQLGSSLEALGYEVVHRQVGRDEGSLSGFDGLVLLAPEMKAFPQYLTPQRLLASVEQGINVFIAFSSELSESWRDFAREFELDFEERNSAVVDHFHYDTILDNGRQTALVVPVATVPVPFISEATRNGSPILFRGVAHARGRMPLVSSILSGAATAYSETESADATRSDILSGQALGLVSGVQAKNNARIMFVGSVDMLSDTFARAAIHSSDGTSFKTSGNAAFVNDLLKWTFHHSGVVRATNLCHSRASASSAEPLYRVRDDLTLSVDLSEYKNGAWHPFTPKDLQFEFVMMDPHLRLPMTPTIIAANFTTMTAHFKAPDRHGVFTIRIDHRRPGWSFVDERTVVSVTPPRHDEYERFITGAIPYYGGVFSVSLALLGFSFVWTLQ